MYESFYGLREKPFSLIPDPDFLFLGRLHAAALSMLEYALRGQASFTLISGEVGCGKTILVRRFLRMMGRRNTVGIVTNTPRQSIRLLEHILLAFNLEYRGKSEVEQYETLVSFVVEQKKLGRRCILIIDEAHNLSEDSLEELRMLSNVNVDKSLALQIILVGQPEIHERLNTRNLRQLVQRISVNFKLLPLTFTETRQYIRHRLHVAGGSPDIFSVKAIALIHLLSGGIPRLINILCDASLVYGFGGGHRTLDDGIVLEVVEDISRGGLDTLPGIDQRTITPALLAAADELVDSLKFEEPEEAPQPGREYFEDEAKFDEGADADAAPAAWPPDDLPRRDAPAIQWDEQFEATSPGKGGLSASSPILDYISGKNSDSRDRNWWLLPTMMFLAILAIAAGALWLYWPLSVKMPEFLASGTPVRTANVTEERPASASVPEAAFAPSGEETHEAAPAPSVAPDRPKTGSEGQKKQSLPNPQPGDETSRDLSPPKAEILATAPNAVESRDSSQKAESPDPPAEKQDNLERLADPLEDLTAVRYASLADALTEQPLGSTDLNSAAVKLFDLWGFDFQTTAGASLCNKAENSGLSCYQSRGRLESALQLNRPTIVGLRNAARPVSYAVVFKRDGNNLSLALGNETVVATIQELAPIVSGSFVTLWRPPPEFDRLLAQGSRGPAVTWVRSILKEVPTVEVAERNDGVFDAELAGAVRVFQEKSGLQVDGIVGTETVIQLINATGAEDEPTLQ